MTVECQSQPTPAGNGRTYAHLVREYFPHASDEEVDYILWELTPFPMGSAMRVEWALQRLVPHRSWFWTGYARAACLCGVSFEAPEDSRRALRAGHAEHVRGY